MRTQSDADSYLKKCLRHPNDITLRLALADWLAATKQPAYVAWAQYIRLNAQLANYPPGEHREKLAAEIQKLIPDIRARLAIPAKLFVHHHEALPQLLPLNRFSVQLDEFTPNREAILLLTERIARVYRVFPLAHTGSMLLLAVADDDTDSVSADLSDFLGVPVLAIGGSPDDIVQAINTHYAGVTSD